MAGEGLPAGLMPQWREQVPEEWLERGGGWAEHFSPRPGVLVHRAPDGRELWTVRLLLPAGGVLAADSFRTLARLVREYGQTGRRTSRQGWEIVGVDPARLEGLIEEAVAAGFPVGGTGASLHGLKACNGYIHCQNAAVNAPALQKRLGDVLYPYIRGGLPAPLKLAVAGCPNGCGGAMDADIGLMGVFLEPPAVDDAALSRQALDLGLLTSWCPTRAIHHKKVPGGISVFIDADRCVHCASCAMVAPEGISMGGKRGVALALGGRGGNRSGAPRLAGVVLTCLPASPLDYPEIVDRVQGVVAAWLKGARRGERLGEYIERRGWHRFLADIGVPAGQELLDDLFAGQVIRRNLNF